jgi:hypothetical protein
MQRDNVGERIDSVNRSYNHLRIAQEGVRQLVWKEAEL